MKNPKDLYIITTARKRDTFEWDDECINFLLSTHKDSCLYDINVKIDSWNNISKYKDVKNSFFLFDEQRLVGSGVWVKSFLKISKSNHWLLLSATPGDTWMDYIPVFIANGFYKNRTEFLRRHAIYNRFTKYPKVDRFVENGHLVRLKKEILIDMDFKKHTVPHFNKIITEFNKELFYKVLNERWNIFENKPVKTIGELFYLIRKVVNGDKSRIEALKQLTKKRNRIIVFYNFNYELEMLRDLSKELNISVSEWNGHKHSPIPKEKRWLYLVQYTAGAEGWNCIETDTVVFYSLNYSYKTMTQAAGRIDRLNTPFVDLYYYYLISNSKIDIAIMEALNKKENFNEKTGLA